jgi:hypothetical protein
MIWPLTVAGRVMALTAVLVAGSTSDRDVVIEQFFRLGELGQQADLEDERVGQRAVGGEPQLVVTRCRVRPDGDLHRNHLGKRRLDALSFQSGEFTADVRDLLEDVGAASHPA